MEIPKYIPLNFYFCKSVNNPIPLNVFPIHLQHKLLFKETLDKINKKSILNENIITIRSNLIEKNIYSDLLITDKSREELWISNYSTYNLNIFSTPEKEWHVEFKDI